VSPFAGSLFVLTLGDLMGAAVAMAIVGYFVYLAVLDAVNRRR